MENHLENTHPPDQENSFLAGVDYLMDKLGISGFTVVDSTVGLALGTQIGLTVVTSNEFVRFVSHGMANNMEELTQFMSPSLQQGLIFLSLLLH